MRCRRTVRRVEQARQDAEKRGKGKYRYSEMNDKKEWVIEEPVVRRLAYSALSKAGVCTACGCTCVITAHLPVHTKVKTAPIPLPPLPDLAVKRTPHEQNQAKPALGPTVGLQLPERQRQQQQPRQQQSQQQQPYQEQQQQQSKQQSQQHQLHQEQLAQQQLQQKLQQSPEQPHQSPQTHPLQQSSDAIQGQVFPELEVLYEQRRVSTEHCASPTTRPLTAPAAQCLEAAAPRVTELPPVANDAKLLDHGCSVDATLTPDEGEARVEGASSADIMEIPDPTTDTLPEGATHPTALPPLSAVGLSLLKERAGTNSISPAEAVVEGDLKVLDFGDSEGIAV